MFINCTKQSVVYQRSSKLGSTHRYTRTKTIVNFACDNCGSNFSRQLGHIDKKRLSNNYYHICGNCDHKRFAQKKGVEKRQIWSRSADSDLDITKL